MLHRRPGSLTWGIDPHLNIDELPETESDALKLRQDADVLPIDEKGHIIANPKTPTPDPRKLLDDGLDVQLQAALVILQAEAVAHNQAQARVP